MQADVVALMMAEASSGFEYCRAHHPAGVRCFDALARDMGADRCLDAAINDLVHDASNRRFTAKQENPRITRERNRIVETVVMGLRCVRDEVTCDENKGWWRFVCEWAIIEGDARMRSVVRKKEDREGVRYSDAVTRFGAAFSDSRSRRCRRQRLLLIDVLGEVAACVCRRTILNDAIAPRTHEIMRPCIERRKAGALRGTLAALVPDLAKCVFEIVDDDAALCAALLWEAQEEDSRRRPSSMMPVVEDDILRKMYALKVILLPGITPASRFGGGGGLMQLVAYGAQDVFLTGSHF